MAREIPGVAQVLGDLLASDASLEASTVAAAGVITDMAQGSAAQSLIEVAVSAAQQHLGMELTFLSEFVGDAHVVRALSNPGQTFPVGVGAATPVEATYCDRVVRGRFPNLIEDARHDPLVSTLPFTVQFDVGSYIGVPVYLADGRLYGTLCAVSHDARPDLRQRDVSFLQVLAAIVADSLARDPDEGAVRRRHAEEVRRVVGAPEFDVVFQPIVRLADGERVGYEALSRFHDDPEARPTEEWFRIAWDIGLGLELELRAVRTALEARPQLPPGRFVAINVDPRTVVAQPFLELVGGHDLEWVVFELTEHAPVRTYEPLREAMAELRRRGARFAIDDVGAGYAGLNHMVTVAPSIIKLDRFLTSGVHDDAVRHALAVSAVAFASATRTTLIAEGIESAAELEALRAAGITYGQGFLLGRPAPVDELGAAATGSRSGGPAPGGTPPAP